MKLLQESKSRLKSLTDIYDGSPLVSRLFLSILTQKTSNFARNLAFFGKVLAKYLYI
jgi:hypothetical protein